MTIWVLTREINEYNQDGEYFEAAWNHKPSLEELENQLNGRYDDIPHILNGGGRKYPENEWFNLHTC